MEIKKCKIHSNAYSDNQPCCFCEAQRKIILGNIIIKTQLPRSDKGIARKKFKHTKQFFINREWKKTLQNGIN